MQNKVIQLYEHFFQVSTNNQNFEFRPKERERKMIDTFVSKLTPSHGEDWLFGYFCYQFSRYIDLKTRFGKGVVMLGWIIGDKALKKYRDASDEEKYWGDQFKTRFNIHNPLIEKQPIEYKEYKDKERRRFYNSVRGLLHCKENDLYNDKNRHCIFCKNLKDCKPI